MNKTNKSFLIKFLTVVCSLCLSLGLVFGLVGCGEDEVTLVNAVVNENGQLVLTYSDGNSNTVDIIGKDGEDLTACEHATLEEISGAVISLNSEYAMYCKVNVAFCLDCKHAVVKTIAHDIGDVPAIEPTCYSEGREAGKGCKNCLYMEEGAIIEKVEHTMVSNYIAYEETTKSICVDGGFLVSYCSVCKDAGKLGDEGLENFTQTPVGGLGHTSTAWQKGNAPTLENGGTLIAAQCDECGHLNVTMDIPALNETNYVKTVKEAKVECTDTETYTYTYVVDNEQSFAYDYTTPAGSHVIGYDDETPILHNKTMYLYDEALFTKLADETETCASAGFDVIFTCKVCNLPVGTKAQLAHQTVAEYNAKHVGAEVQIQNAATFKECAGGRYENYNCDNCEEVVGDTEAEVAEYLTIAPVAHKFTYTEGATYADSTIDIYGTCDYGCGTVDNYSKAVAEYVKQDSTCTEVGKETWTITEVGGNTLATPIVAEKEIAKKQHKLGEEYIDTTKTLDWAIYKDKGVTKLADAVETCAAGGFNAVFTCSECSQPVGVTAAVLHTMPTTGVIQPTCLDYGSYTCTVCHVAQTADERLAPTDHDYTYTMTLNDESTLANITGVCANECGVADDYKNIDVTTLVKGAYVAPKCDATGSQVYIWNNGAATATVTLAKTQHKFNGQLVDTTKIQYVEDGFTKLADTDAPCNSTTGVDGIFTCEACSQPVGVKVKAKHVAVDGTEFPVATCANAGTTVNYICAVCDATDCVYEIPTPAHESNFYFKASTLVAPTTTGTGTIQVWCSQCDCIKATVTLKALNDYTATEKEDIAATCQNAAATIYTYTDATYGAYSFSIVTGKKGSHTLDTKEITWTYTDTNGKVWKYTGKLCLNDGDDKIIVTKKVDITPVA